MTRWLNDASHCRECGASWRYCKCGNGLPVVTGPAVPAPGANCGYDGRTDVYPANEWEVVHGEMVICPRCAFAFGAEHVTQATGQYDCPVCDASSCDGVPS